MVGEDDGGHNHQQMESLKLFKLIGATFRTNFAAKA
jgi:hypothetical protein